MECAKNAPAPSFVRVRGVPVPAAAALCLPRAPRRERTEAQEKNGVGPRKGVDRCAMPRERASSWTPGRIVIG